MDSGNSGNSGNNSTHEESSKIANEEDSNIYQGLVAARISRPTLQPALLFSRHKSNRTSQLDQESKNNETLPIKRTISSFNFKIVLIGNVSVGKSSIIRRFVHNDFNNSYLCTVGTELFRKSLFIGENKQVNLFIWDTCGQERFRSVTRQYYHDTQAILLVFDLTNKKTFNNLNSWYEEALNYINNTNCLFFLLGNKWDETEKIVVESEEIKNFMKKNQKIKKYFEVSACNGHNIDLAFDKISRHLIMKYSGDEIVQNVKELQDNNVKLENEDINKNKNKKKGSGCC